MQYFIQCVEVTILVVKAPGLYKVEAVWCLHFRGRPQLAKFFLVVIFFSQILHVAAKITYDFLFSKQLQTLHLVALPWALPNDEGEGGS